MHSGMAARNRERPRVDICLSFVHVLLVCRSEGKRSLHSTAEKQSMLQCVGISKMRLGSNAFLQTLWEDAKTAIFQLNVIMRLQ